MVYKGAVPVLSLDQLELRYRDLMASIINQQRQQVVPHKDALNAKYQRLHEILKKGLDDIALMYAARRDHLTRVISGQVPEPHGGIDAVQEELNKLLGQMKQHHLRQSEMLGQLIHLYGEEDLRTPDRQPSGPPWAASGPAQQGSSNGQNPGAYGANSAPTYPAQGQASYPGYPVDDYPTRVDSGSFRQPFPASGAHTTGGIPRVSTGPTPRWPGGMPPPGAPPRGYPTGPSRRPPPPPPGSAQVDRRRRPAPMNVVPRGLPPGYAPPARRRTGRRGKLLGWTAVALVIALVAVALMRVSGGSSGYPSSVGQVRAWVNTACQDQNTAIPGAPGSPGVSGTQFACGDGKDILWVFAYMTSDNNPNYVGPTPSQKGAEPRQGLMPVTVADDQQYANSLRPDHPFFWWMDQKYIQSHGPEPTDTRAIDSLKVGALILNAIVYGTTYQPQAGLESNASNCGRYTGVASTVALSSGIVVCSSKLTTQGKYLLVHDLYLHWATSRGVQADQTLLNTAANYAEVLFANPDGPSNATAKAALAWVQQNHKRLLV